MADLIDRDAALRKFIKGDGDDDFTAGYNFAVDEYRQKIADIPSVNHWMMAFPPYLMPLQEPQETEEN